MKKIFTSIIMFSLGVFVIYGCAENSDINNKEADIPSRLTGCVVTRDMLGDRWEWKEYASTLWTPAPTIENKHTSLKIFSRMYGYDQGTNYEFHISSMFNEYNQNFELENDPEYVSTPFESIIRFNPDFHQTGKEMIYSCGKEMGTKNPNSFICDIQVGFEKHSSTISISSPSESSREEIEGIVNPLLDSINACVSKIESE